MGIAAITGNIHSSLRYFVLLERITSCIDVDKKNGPPQCYNSLTNFNLVIYDRKKGNIV